MVVLAGQTITAGMFPATKSATQDSASTFTSTTYTETGGGNAFPSLTFVAPLSGEVEISHQAFIDNSTTARTYYSWIVREGAVIGSGTVFLDGDDERSINNITTDDSRHGATYHMTGLTPLATYNLKMKGKVSTASTGTVQWQHVIVKPCV
jgi:hypothetical protein